MFRSQEGWDKVIWLVIVLKSIIEFSMEMWLLGESSGQFLEIHLTFDQTQFNSTGISHVTEHFDRIWVILYDQYEDISPVSSEFVFDKTLGFFLWEGCSIDSHKIWSSSHESFVKGQNTESWCSLNKMLRNYYVMRLPSIIVISPGTFQKLFFFLHPIYTHVKGLTNA